MTAEPETFDGGVRPNRRSETHSPWDAIVAEGWAPEFAAGQVLYCLRDPNLWIAFEQRQRACWYWQQLKKLAAESPASRAHNIIQRLTGGLPTRSPSTQLTDKEMAVLNGGY